MVNEVSTSFKMKSFLSVMALSTLHLAKRTISKTPELPFCLSKLSAPTCTGFNYISHSFPSGNSGYSSATNDMYWQPGSSQGPNALWQQFPTFSAPGTGVMEGNFSTDWSSRRMVWGWFKGITFIVHFISIGAFLVVQMPAMWETQVWFLGQEDPLEKRMATHPSIFARTIPKDRGA